MKKMFFLLLFLVSAQAKAQIASFIISSDTVCQDSCIQFINTSTGHIDSLLWSVSGDTTNHPHSDTIVVCFPTDGLDTIELFIFDSGRIDSAIHFVMIKKMPHPLLIDTLPSFLGQRCGLYVPAVFSSYQWYFRSGIAISDTTNYISGTAGNFVFVLVDSNGCFGTSDTTGRCIEGIKNLAAPETDIILFPNPVINELTITGCTPPANISIFNLIGQTFRRQKYNSTQVQINVADLPPGIYILKINGTDVRKFVKE